MYPKFWTTGGGVHFSEGRSYHKLIVEALIEEGVMGIGNADFGMI